MHLRRHSLSIELVATEILYLVWLYVIGNKILIPSAPRWPDIEYVTSWARQAILWAGPEDRAQRRTWLSDPKHGAQLAQATNPSGTQNKSVVSKIQAPSDHTIQEPVSTKADAKSWVGDKQLVKLLDRRNSTMMLMNPGPLSFMKLYEKWNGNVKIWSRLGGAVWGTVRAVESLKEEQVEEHSENELGEAEDNERPETQEMMKAKISFQIEGRCTRTGMCVRSEPIR
ncbi:hypothetical protein P3342_002881, partial [Pyrenophora teres f. teres]